MATAVSSENPPEEEGFVRKLIPIKVKKVVPDVDLTPEEVRRIEELNLKYRREMGNEIMNRLLFGKDHEHFNEKDFG